jgi:hypothetical protein
MDRVQVLKRESAALGGDAADETPYDSPIEPQEDALEAAGVYLQDPTHRDEQVLVRRDGDNLKFKDVSNPIEKTLTDLIAGTGGLTVEAHKVVRHLIHFIKDGPCEGFTTGAYKETLPAGAVFPTSEIWWESSSKVKKIVELTTTWSGAKKTAEEWKMYDTDGTTVLVTVTDTITYSGAFEASRTRAIVLPP